MPTTITGTSLTVGSIDLTTPLATSDGGSKLYQIVTYQTGAVATGTTQIPWDDTIPQITEGDQYLSLAITPVNTLSTLEIDILLEISCSAIDNLTMALFQDATANSLAVSGLVNNSINNNYTLTLKHLVVSGTTSPTTFKVRAGPSAAYTVTVNGVSGARKFGGVLASRITIKEYLP